jgi:hypothetical protein
VFLIFINGFFKGIAIACGLAVAYWIFVDLFGFHVQLVIG